MSTPALHIVPPTDFTECVVCQKPLGADSRDARMRLCHEHRKCVVCGRDLNAIEQRLAHDTSVANDGEPIEPVHPRCKAATHPTIEQDPTLSIKQSEYDYLNMLRLMVIPDEQLSVTTNENNAMIQCNRLITSMASFDEKLLHLRMLEACVAQASIAVRTDPKYRKDALAEREKKHQERVKKEALTSSRPTSVPATDIEEQRIGAFMQKYGLKDRKIALTILKDRDKAVTGFTKSGIPTIQAIDLVEGMMIKSGRLTAPPEKEKE